MKIFLVGIIFFRIFAPEKFLEITDLKRQVSEAPPAIPGTIYEQQEASRQNPKRATSERVPPQVVPCGQGRGKRKVPEARRVGIMKIEKTTPPCRRAPEA